MKKVFFLFTVSVYLSCTNKTEQNFEDISKIKTGMNYQEVRKIMRNDYSGRTSLNYDYNLFLEKYESPSGASDDYGIIFRKKDSIVVEINLGD